jgi:hypothetical protein
MSSRFIHVVTNNKNFPLYNIYPFYSSVRAYLVCFRIFATATSDAMNMVLQVSLSISLDAFFFFSGTGVWTQGLMLARKVLLALEPVLQPLFQFLFLSFFFSVPGFELRVFTLSHYSSPFLWIFFFEIGRGSQTICSGLALKQDPPDFCFLSS